MDNTDLNIDSQTINKLGLRLSNKLINAQIAPDARIFEYPDLDNVYIMESDLYGNKMPKDSCFLAFYGQHGLMGQQMSVDTLLNTNAEDIHSIVNSNKEG